MDYNEICLKIYNDYLANPNKYDNNSCIKLEFDINFVNEFMRLVSCDKNLSYKILLPAFFATKINRNIIDVDVIFDGKQIIIKLYGLKMDSDIHKQDRYLVYELVITNKSYVKNARNVI